MILIISSCKEPLSEQEFVAPLVALAQTAKQVHHKEITPKDISSAEKIIISGTALADFDYLSEDFDWSWLKTCEKPVLGICAGAQVIAREFSWTLAKARRIGVQKVEVIKENPLLDGSASGYFLHSYDLSGGEVLATSEKVPALLKVDEKPIFACVFHPEVMTEQIIRNFIAKDLNK